MSETIQHITGPLRDLINKLAINQSQPIDVLLPGGNKGDGLIYQGAFRLFSDCNLKYKVHQNPIKRNYKYMSDTLLILGSGGFSKFYHSVPSMIEAHSSLYKKVYVLPSTFDISVDVVNVFLNNLPDNVTLFCRERYSYNNVKLISGKHNVFLDHDTAMFMDYSPWRNRGGKGTLHAFRSDAEKPSAAKLERGNLDISVGSYNSWLQLIEEISMFDIVHTNRAHGMIAAAMLGKETYAYDSCYFKQREIYNYSLSHMSNVTFK